MARIVITLAVSALAGLLIIPLARQSAPAEPPAPARCTGVLAPGSSC